MLVTTAARIIGCPRHAEDIVQNIALKLCECPRLPEFKDPHGYVRRMVRNAAIDAVRRVAGERRVIAADADAEKAPEPTGCALDRMEACEALAAAIDALAQMPVRTRAALVAHRLRGEAQKDIAARLGVSPTLVNFMVRDATAVCREAAEAPHKQLSALMPTDAASRRSRARSGPSRLRS
ncbi:sigma-70 family RNA polymerase sigma factor [Methylopila sp. M107]|uniref:sigma-70 family RNA polymerase sigma factor n=1 Tax=Methylopila sp. M107 TaxID=1101190 RepID=UPI002476C910|nr:sigma-70 family RNA polymerase sigma factor [Methylopila sp. M107]